MEHRYSLSREQVSDLGSRIAESIVYHLDTSRCFPFCIFSYNVPPLRLESSPDPSLCPSARLQAIIEAVRLKYLVH
jgi:hypothetical protein